VSPRIVVCEYNSLFGCRHPVSVVYEPNFVRRDAHYSKLFFGASLPALGHLAKTKGYVFVGSNSTGHNAFFVREDVIGDLPRAIISEEFTPSRFRESIGFDGMLDFLSGDARGQVISDLEVVDVVTGHRRKVGEL
jgi:hypothetical protein